VTDGNRQTALSPHGEELEESLRKEDLQRLYKWSYYPSDGVY
jgi:hypothetical protein